MEKFLSGIKKIKKAFRMTQVVTIAFKHIGNALDEIDETFNGKKEENAK